MIHLQTYLNLIDNSGAKSLQCIQILNKSKRKSGVSGGKIKVSVKDSISKKKIKSGKLYTSMITSIKKKRIRVDGSSIKTGNNYAMVLSSQDTPFATRLVNFVPYEISTKEYPKVISICKYRFLHR